MTWLFLALLGGCSSKVYAPPPAPIELGLAEADGDHWGILEQASGLMDTSVRQRALYLLVRHWPDPAAGQWSARGLQDPSPYVQRKSLEGLGTRLSEPESRAALLRYAKRQDTSPFNTAKAAILLSDAPPAELLTVIEDHLLVDRHHSERAPLLFAAARLGSTQALPALASALQKGDFPLEMDFLMSLGDTQHPEVAEALVEGLALYEEELHLPIAHSLVRLGHPAGEQIFREALRSEETERPNEALDFLDTLLHPVADPLLRRVAPAAADHGRLLRESRTPGLPRFAMDSLASTDRELRLQALRALSLWSERFDMKPSARRAIRASATETLRDLEASVQREALRLLGIVGTRADKKHIEPFLASEDPSHRVEAAGAVLSIEIRANDAT